LKSHGDSASFGVERPENLRFHKRRTRGYSNDALAGGIISKGQEKPNSQAGYWHIRTQQRRCRIIDAGDFQLPAKKGVLQ
jgi:hypothetical protein